MVASGIEAVDNGWVQFPEEELIAGFNTDDQIQPNGVDLRVKAITQLEGSVVVPRDGKVTFSNIRQNQMPFKEAYTHLKPGLQYLVDYHEFICVPDGYCAIIVGRSSLLRGGALVTSALWDTGFYGQLGGVIRPLIDIRIEYGARLAQVLFLKANESKIKYSGRYQGSTSQSALMT